VGGGGGPPHPTPPTPNPQSPIPIGNIIFRIYIKFIITLILKEFIDSITDLKK
jgi:hypothetical protein